MLLGVVKAYVLRVFEGNIGILDVWHVLRLTGVLDVCVIYVRERENTTIEGRRNSSRYFENGCVQGVDRSTCDVQRGQVHRDYEAT